MKKKAAIISLCFLLLLQLTENSFAKEKVYAYINKNAPIELIDTSGNPYNI